MPGETTNSALQLESFATDESALQYLRTHIPPASEDQAFDLEAFRAKLFATPEAVEDIVVGDHEYKGAGGLEVGFRLYDSSNLGYNQYWQDVRPDTSLTGSWKPMFSMLDLSVRSPNFSYSLKGLESQQHAQINTIHWLPGLRSEGSELSHNVVNIGRRHIYLVDQDGFLSNPLAMLGFFHEVGHIETGPDLPKDDASATHDGFTGHAKPLTPRMAAYMLQRERAANDWMINQTRPLFEDIGIAPSLVEDYCRYVQLKSYHDSLRAEFLDPPEALVST